ncbi:phage tail tape measure protein [Leuconostoc falkenbergense]|uniref:phage tail tape measure protein n=1 Tax=Leuconostoc falkenbergense TaxID=2766470 RepID=UPI0024A9F36C|nr:phage tail tape measure protein [Leuconostoc falkenbergense]MDI6553091.1 phage tail tape measure protein [Leuconostoc falkenbergense]
MESYSVQAVLSAVDKNFSKAFKDAADSTQTLQQRSGKALTAVGKSSALVGAAVGVMAGKAIKSYGDFQNSINQAAVIGGSSNKSLSGDMKGLEKVALSLGKTLPVSAEDAAKAMVEMARNGASVGELKKEFPAIAKAAAVSGEDMTATATTVQQAMNIWGGGAKNAAKDSAILAVVANRSNATIGDMGQVFANVGTTAKNLGFSLKDVGIAAGLMTNAGIPAAQASQDLNHALSQMVKPSKSARATMQELGLSYTDAQGNMKPLKQIIQETAKATEGMGGAQKTAALNTLFGAAGAKAIAPLIDSVGKKAQKSGKGWDSFSSSIDKAAGSTAKANKYLTDNSQNMTKNVGQAINQMLDAFDALIKTSIGSIAPQIKAVANAVGDFATWLTTSKSPMAAFTKQLIAWSPVIAGVLLVFGGLSMALGKLIGAFSAPAKSLGMFGGSAKSAGKLAGVTGGQLAGMGVKAAGIGIGIGAAAAGIGVLAFGIAALAKTGTKGLVALGAMTGAIVILAATFAILQGPLTAAVPAMLSLSVVMLSAGAAALMIGSSIALAGLGIKLAGQGVMILVQAFILLGNNINMIIPLLTVLGAGLAALVVTFLSRVIAAVPQIAAQFLTMFTKLLNMIATYTPVLVAGFASIIIGFISSLITYVPQIVAKVVALLVAMMNAVAQNAPQLITAFVNMVVKILQSLTDNLPKFISAGVDFIVSLLKGVEDSIGKIVPVVIDIIVKFINSIANNLDKIINAGINLLAKFIMGIVNAIPRLASIAVQAVEKFVYGVGNALGQVLRSGTKLLGIFVRGIMDGFGKSRSSGSGAANAVKNGIMSISLSGAGQAIMNGFLGGLKSAYGAVQSFVGGIAGWVYKHKGPISYDRKLLIPAGNAIMNGLNAGLVDNFKTVQKNVSGMAGSILDVATSVGNLATNAIGDPINALNNNIGGSYSSVMTLDHTSTTQPANITIGFDKHGYTAYVDDINNQQGKTALLKRNNSVQL